MMVKDEWVKTAMMDDRVVVELLVRLKQAQAVAAPKPRPMAVIPLRWGIRLPRSRPGASASMRCDVVSRRKEGDSSTRCSPTTPLSWSGGGGGASPSATADGFEETSHHASRSPSGVRSKGTNTAETTGTTTRRSRRKKTFAELKEEESLLLKERIYLNKELATLHVTCKEQRARNENLKRMKLDLNMQYSNNLSSTSVEPEKAICSQPHRREGPSLNHFPSTLQTPQSDSCETQKSVSDHNKFFLLPDLNMIPTGEDYDAETLYGTRQ